MTFLEHSIKYSLWYWGAQGIDMNMQLDFLVVYCKHAVEVRDTNWYWVHREYSVHNWQISYLISTSEKFISLSVCVFKSLELQRKKSLLSVILNDLAVWSERNASSTNLSFWVREVSLSSQDSADWVSNVQKYMRHFELLSRSLQIMNEQKNHRENN